MARLVALLRGINLGSKRRVPMADLRALIGDLGYEDVRTVLQSGNVVFTGPVAKTQSRLERALADRFGFDVDVVLRTMDEVRQVVEGDPFGDEAHDHSRYVVAFLAAAPDAAALAALEDRDFAPEKLVAARREIYAWCPNGLQNSNLMKALGKPSLGAVATVRNMRTVCKLVE